MNFLMGTINYEKNDKSNSFIEIAEANAYPHFIGKHIFSNQNVDMCVYLHKIAREEFKTEELTTYTETNLIIAADAFLYNRLDLCNRLAMDDSSSDSQIILSSFIQWGLKCTDYLHGDFVFVIHSINENKTYIFRDHVGKNLLYYRIFNGKLIFSSDMKTILKLSHYNVDLNKNWVANYFLSNSPITELDGEITVYESIFQVPPASYMIIDNGKSQKERYWNPLKERKKHTCSTEDITTKLSAVTYQAVRDRIDDKFKNAILMSSGLDSSVIGGMAAYDLRKKNSRLKSYTSIPLKSFDENIGKYNVANEKALTSKMGEMHQNIDMTFIDSIGEDAITCIDKMIGIIEQPYKFIANSHWIKSINDEMNNDNVDIILTGAFGNTSISFGEFFPYLIHLVHKGKIFKGVKLINDFCNKYSFSKSKYFRFIAHEVKPSINSDLYYSIVDSVLLEKNFSSDVVQIVKNNYSIKPSGYRLNGLTYDKLREINITNKVLSQINHAYTKIELKTGMIYRDPSMDKEVVEFCFGIPDEYLHDGIYDRQGVRRIGKSFVPEEIRELYFVRGYQGADWLYRLHLKESQLIDEVNDVMENSLMDKYVSKKKVQNIITEISEKGISRATFDITQNLVSVVIFGKFLKKFSEERRKYENGVD